MSNSDEVDAWLNAVCHFGFDTVIAHFVKQPLPVPTGFSDRDCILSLQWFKPEYVAGRTNPILKSFGNNNLSLNPISIHSRFQQTLANSLRGRPPRPSVLPTDLRRLLLRLSVINTESLMPLDQDQWTLGTHGLLCNVTVNNKRYAALFFPDVLSANGWDVEAGVERLIEESAKQHDGGKLTAKERESIRNGIRMFSISRKELLYREYEETILARVKSNSSNGKQKQTKSASGGDNSSDQVSITDEQIERWKAFRSLIKPDSTNNVPGDDDDDDDDDGDDDEDDEEEEEDDDDRSTKEKGSDSGAKKKKKNKKKKPSIQVSVSQQNSTATLWVLGGIVLAVIGMLVLRYYADTYDVSYEDFMNNYAILGIDPSASAKEERAAFRKLSLQWHPDKNPGCKECAEKYIAIAEAHRQITDYEAGVLKITNKPTKFNKQPQGPEANSHQQQQQQQQNTRRS